MNYQCFFCGRPTQQNSGVCSMHERLLDSPNASVLKTRGSRAAKPTGSPSEMYLGIVPVRVLERNLLPDRTWADVLVPQPKRLMAKVMTFDGDGPVWVLDSELTTEPKTV